MTHLQAAYSAEVQAYLKARTDKDFARAWQFLERAHILSQSVLRLHLHVHVLMLAFATSRQEWREAWGQALRLMLVPLGALLGRLPLGNTGRASVSAFVSMPIPDDLQRFLNPSLQARSRRTWMRSGEER
jgi:hypothetical protein